MNEFDSGLIDSSFESHSRVLEETQIKHRDTILKAADLIAQSYDTHGKVVLFGNGGSAADAQHLAAEFVGRFLRDRPSLPAVALTTDPSIVTAIANDYGFDKVFARQIEALVSPHDVIVAISTSGNSANVVVGVEAAKRKGAKVIALTGQGGGNLAELVDVLIDIPSIKTPRIQEMHILVGHLICEIVESKIFA